MRSHSSGAPVFITQPADEVPPELAALDAAVAAAPDDVGARRNRAEALTSLHRYAEAERDLRHALRFAADDVELLTALGGVLCRGGRWRDALVPLQRAIELAPEQGVAHYHLAEVYNHVAQFPAALASYETAARLLPDAWRAHKGAGHVLDRMGRPTEAAVAHRKARDAQRPPAQRPPASRR
jgi:Flp pilus assembly protein TadD